MFTSETKKTTQNIYVQFSINKNTSFLKKNRFIIDLRGTIKHQYKKKVKRTKKLKIKA
jgi:peroxiredoxin